MVTAIFGCVTGAHAQALRELLLLNGNISPAYDCNYLLGSFCGAESIFNPTGGTNLLPTSPSGATFTTFPAGVPRFALGGGLLIEEARTNYLLNSGTPATQTTGTLPAGSITLWVNGSGSATLTNLTTTGCSGTASQGSPLTVTITAGTCLVTVSGSLNEFQLEAGAYGLSYIPTTTAAVARALDIIEIGRPALTAMQAANVSTVVEFLVEGVTPSTDQTILGANFTGGPLSLFSGFPSVGAIEFGFVHALTPGVIYRIVGSGNLTTTFFGAYSFLGAVVSSPRTSGAFIPSAPTTVTLGSNETAASAINGIVRRISIYNRAIPNSALAAKTVVGGPL